MPSPGKLIAAGDGVAAHQVDGRGDGPPCRRRVAGLRDRPATLGLRYGPDSYGRQQWGILRNGGNPDAATPRAGRRPSGCKPLSAGNTKRGYPQKKPRLIRASSRGNTYGARRYPDSLGVKRVGGALSRTSNPRAQPRPGPELALSSAVGESGIPGVAVECADETRLRETLRTCRSDIGNLEVLFGFERTITLNCSLKTV